MNKLKKKRRTASRPPVPTKKQQTATKGARVMWETAHRRGGTIILHTQTESEDRPVFVLAATPEAIEEMREVVARAAYSRALELGKWGFGWKNEDDAIREEFRGSADKYLSSIGLALPTPSRSRRGRHGKEVGK